MREEDGCYTEYEMDETSRDERGVKLLKEGTCDLYRPGHQVHRIQANLAGGDTRRQGKAVIVSEDGWIKVAIGNHVEQFWHHDVERARDILAVCGGRVEVSIKGLLMAGPQEDGSYYNICVADAKKGATPCFSMTKTLRKIPQSETGVGGPGN